MASVEGGPEAPVEDDVPFGDVFAASFAALPGDASQDPLVWQNGWGGQVGFFFLVLFLLSVPATPGDSPAISNSLLFLYFIE